MKKPIIGIICRHFENNGARPNLYIREEIKDAVIFNGGFPIGIVPPTGENIIISKENESEILKNLDKILSKKQQEFLITQIKMCNGIILQGGAASDAYEIFVSRFCYDNDIPILEICAGQSNLVRGLGGSTKSVELIEKHNEPDATYVHNITIFKSSILYNIIKKTNIEVNSRHKNCINNTSVLNVSAVDDDGNIEAIEAKDKRFFLGVRFHPESLYKIDKNHNNIFKHLVETCKKY